MAAIPPPPAEPSPHRRGALGAVRTLLTNSFGSDTLTAYTAEYAWLSNQMAHAMMGFFLAALWAFAVQLKHNDGLWLWACVWMPLAVPPLKEAVDYVLDAALHRHTFALNHAELLADAATDVFFWSFGMLLAIAVFGFDAVRWPLLAVVVGGGALVALALIFGVWVRRMRMFDASRMPFNYLRLVKYRDPEALLGAGGVERVREYQEFARRHRPGADGRPRHLILTGGRPVDRSRLAVSLGCEFIGRWKGAYMISAVKLLEDPSRMTTACQMAREYKAEVCCLIVDDLNVNLPLPPRSEPERAAVREAARKSGRLRAAGASVTPEAAAAVASEKVSEFFAVFDELRADYPHVATVWVLSGAAADAPETVAWREFIRDLVRSTDEPTVLTLNETQPGMNEG